MKFTLNGDILRAMFDLSSFIMPDDDLVFVSLRGVQPLVSGGSPFSSQHDLLAVPLDYTHMRCTIVQWRPREKELAVFTGSSVPHMSAIQSVIGANGDGVNRLATGYFGKVPGLPDHRYRKGNHGRKQHLAFRNESKLPVWRTSDDADYEGDDRFEVEVVYDNLHCAHQMNDASPFYSSNGCVVVGGKAGEPGARKITSELGGWRTFLTNAYSLQQDAFALAVFEQNEALRTVELGPDNRAPTVRFGSRGELVERIQKGLVNKGYDLGSPPDGLFGAYTANALRQFQLATFGKGGADLIAGRGTAEALGVTWPESGKIFFAGLKGLESRGKDDKEIPTAKGDADTTKTDLVPDPQLRTLLNTNHEPLPGWRIVNNAPDAKGRANWSLACDDRPNMYLGYFMDYSGYGDPHTKGLARTAASPDGLAYKPDDWKGKLGWWPELLYPTAWAESNASFTVINAWDRAAMTLGFIQLAAHTGDDFLPLLRRLVTELPKETKQWFPELQVIGGKLCYVAGTKYKTLENAGPAWDGGYSASYYHGDLMGYFNPERFHPDAQSIDQAELHTAARWLIWTRTSDAMRAIQVEASIDNLKSSVNLLHRAILKDPAAKARYPGGVDGMRCDLLSVAIAAPHLGDGYVKTIVKALATADPIDAIRASNYGPGGRSANVHAGMLKRPVLKSLVYDFTNQRPV